MMADVDEFVAAEFARIRENAWTSRLPADIRPVLDSIELPEAIEQWLVDWPNRGNLVLSGAVGVGKTTMALAVINRLRQRGVQWRWTPFRRMVDDVISRRQSIVRWVEPPALLLDDLIAEQFSTREISVLAELLDTRTAPMVITSNVPIEVFEELFGERCADRLVRACLPVRFASHESRRTPGEAVRVG